jgi:hypothetical protein
MMQVMFGNRSHNTRCGAAVQRSGRPACVWLAESLGAWCRQGCSYPLRKSHKERPARSFLPEFRRNRSPRVVRSSNGKGSRDSLGAANMNDRRPALRKLGRNQCTCQRGIYIAQPQQDVGRFPQQRRSKRFIISAVCTACDLDPAPRITSGCGDSRSAKHAFDIAKIIPLFRV